MNLHHSNEFLVAAATRRCAVSSSHNLKITLITLQISAAPCLVHEALTAIVKDCGRIGKKASARIWRDQKPAPIRTRCSDCSLQDAAMENSHGFESRTQAARADHHRQLRDHQHGSACPAIDRRRQDSNSAREGYPDA